MAVEYKQQIFPEVYVTHFLLGMVSEMLPKQCRKAELFWWKWNPVNAGGWAGLCTAGIAVIHKALLAQVHAASFSLEKDYSLWSPAHQCWGVWDGFWGAHKLHSWWSNDIAVQKSEPCAGSESWAEHRVSQVLNSSYFHVWGIQDRKRINTSLHEPWVWQSSSASEQPQPNSLRMHWNKCSLRRDKAREITAVLGWERSGVCCSPILSLLNGTLIVRGTERKRD